MILKAYKHDYGRFFRRNSKPCIVIHFLAWDKNSCVPHIDQQIKYQIQNLMSTLLVPFQMVFRLPLFWGSGNQGTSCDKIYSPLAQNLSNWMNSG